MRNNFDWENYTDYLTQKFYSFKYNTLDYDETKSICEDEVMYYMENDDDNTTAVSRRVAYRIKNNLVYFNSSKERDLFYENFDYIESVFARNCNKKTFRELLRNFVY